MKKASFPIITAKTAIAVLATLDLFEVSSAADIGSGRQDSGRCLGENSRRRQQTPHVSATLGSRQFALVDS